MAFVRIFEQVDGRGRVNVWGSRMLMGSESVRESEITQRLAGGEYPRARVNDGILVCGFSSEKTPTNRLRSVLAKSRAIIPMNERGGLQNIPVCNSFMGCAFCAMIVDNAELPIE